MDQYTINCTQNQCDRAIKLGAPIEKGEKVTAEQMIGWLDTKQIEVLVACQSSFTSFEMAVNTPKKYLTHTHEYETRREAMLEGIDIALDYLLGLPTKEQLPKDLKVGDCLILHDESTEFIKVLSVRDDYFTAEIYSVEEERFINYREMFDFESLNKEAVETSQDIFDRMRCLYQEFADKRDVLLEQRKKEETTDLHIGDVLFFINQDEGGEVCKILSTEPKISYEGLLCEYSFQSFCMKDIVDGKLEGCFLMPSDSFDKLKDLSYNAVQQAKQLVESVYFIDDDGFGHLK